MNNQNAYAHGSIRQLFGQPKLTEEQREEIKQALKEITKGDWIYNGNEIVTAQNTRCSIGGFLKDGDNHLAANAPEWLKDLLSSEQAWREEAEQLRHNQRIERDLLNAAQCKADEYLYRYERAQVQLNQAVEVLRHATQELYWGDPENAVERTTKKINDFMFALSQQEDKP